VVTIHLNGESREIESQIDLVGLLEHFEITSQHVAVELNGRVIRRIDWPGTKVNDGDRVEVVHFVGGG
jgi:thiamine biosynthesis protein ThiS